MLVIRVFGHQLFEEFLQVAPRGRRGIFHDHEAATRVLHEGGHGAGRNFAALDNLLDLGGDFIGPFFLRPDLETFIMNVHGHGPHASNRRAVRNHP